VRESSIGEQQSPKEDQNGSAAQLIDEMYNEEN